MFVCQEKSEPQIGIEPMNESFADSCLTTWLLRHGTRGETRTHDPLLRRQMLYPTELLPQNYLKSNLFSSRLSFINFLIFLITLTFKEDTEP
jgi:hypothetical protein